MDLFLTEEDYLPAEFDELPLDEAILRVREIEDERDSSSRKKSKEGKEKRKRQRDDDEEEDRSDGPDDQYSDDDGWLVNDLGNDEFMDEDDEDRVVTVKDGVKVFGPDEAEEEDDGKGDDKKKKTKKYDDDEKEKKPRRRINTGPRVVLNVDRLKNVNALAALPEIQRKLHFKGKGHEEEDLATIMQTMEHWAHRVMPKMKFDEFIEKAEQLGTKKILKAFVSKIRIGLSLDTNGDIPGIDFEAMGRDSEEEFAFDDDLPPMPPVNAEDAFDAIMREAEEVVKQRAAEAAAASAFSSPSVSGLQSTMTNLDLNKTLTPMKSTTQTMSSQSTTPVTSKTPTSSSLTEEQRRKIAENARKAAEKRLSLQMARSQPIPTSQPTFASQDIEL